MRERWGAVSSLTRHVLAWSVTMLAAVPTDAQELEPRAYAALPVSANFLVAGLIRSEGGVLADPTLPITDVRAGLSAGTLGLGRSVGIGGRLVLVTAAVPYSWGRISGEVGEQARSITRSGLGDARVKVSVNLAGNPPLAPAAFAQAPRRTVAGVSLTVIAPTGQHDPRQLINVGSGRWAFKPEVGVSKPLGRWDLEGYGGVWLFTEDDRYFPGNARRRQAPIAALQGHASYTFKGRAWAAVDATWYGGGETRVDDGPPTRGQSNLRFGATLSLPLGRMQSVKIAYSTGAAIRTGSDFDVVAVAWQAVWFDRVAGRPSTPRYFGGSPRMPDERPRPAVRP